MKTSFSVLTGLLLLNISACSRDNDLLRGKDDITIERQEDYESKDARESRNLPLETDDEIEVDRDVLGDDEVEIDD